MNHKREYPVLAQKLQGIAPEVTTEDVMKACLELGCHHETVRRYLRGAVGKRVFGEQLFDYLENKVQEREKAENHE